MSRTVSEVLHQLSALQTIEVSGNPFKLVCHVSPPATQEEIEAAWPDGTAAGTVVGMWLVSRSATLFEDSEYGQWGLRLLTPADSASRSAVERGRRPGDVRADDMIIGEFLGDLELLVFAPSEVNSRRILVALPLDSRIDWDGAGGSIEEFLDMYQARGGDKFWEGNG